MGERSGEYGRWARIFYPIGSAFGPSFLKKCAAHCRAAVLDLFYWQSTASNLVQSLSLLMPIVVKNPFFIMCHNSIQKWLSLIDEQQSRTHFETVKLVVCSQLVWQPIFYLFTLPMPFKWCTTVEWSMSRIFANSWVLFVGHFPLNLSIEHHQCLDHDPGFRDWNQ